MIFITLGSQKFQFNRLLKAVDQLVENFDVKEKIFAQIGYSDYKPKRYEYSEFLNSEQFSSIMDQASIVITHGGTGAIIGAVKKKKKVIAVPRLKEYGEHVDDHQIQVLKQFRDLDLIYFCDDMNLEKALETVKEKQYREYISNTDRFIQDIEEFINL